MRDETTAEGESVRRFHTLQLSRASTAVFALSWTAVHPITESSPLYGVDPELLATGQAVLVASLVGIEEATAQTVHARHTWTTAEILYDHRFKDVLRLTSDGQRALDYTAFHEVEPAPPQK
ncbi:MAG TPA: hypothetical protein VKU41_28085 [Polyangiaceae bacterium]|nr:hypothetical protein [Polyangiaceae bacterium]